MIVDTVFIPLGYSHDVLLLCHLAIFFTIPLQRWPSDKTKEHCENNTISAIIIGYKWCPWITDYGYVATLKNFEITVVHTFLLYLILGLADIKVFGHQ